MRNNEYNPGNLRNQQNPLDHAAEWQAIYNRRNNRFHLLRRYVDEWAVKKMRQEAQVAWNRYMHYLQIASH